MLCSLESNSSCRERISVMLLLIFVMLRWLRVDAAASKVKYTYGVISDQSLK